MSVQPWILAFSIAQSPNGRSKLSLNFQIDGGAIGQFLLRASGFPLWTSRCQADMSPNHSSTVAERGGSLQPSPTHWLSKRRGEPQWVANLDGSHCKAQLID